MCNSPADAGGYLIMALPARINGMPYLHEISPPEKQGWANYFRHAVAKNMFAMLDNFAWWRVIRMLQVRHHWSWKDVRRHFTVLSGRWLPITAGKVEMRRIAAIPVTRYRYRGTKIPSPWTTLAPA